MARNLRPGDDWVPATVVERTGPVSYLVETGAHQLWKRHVDQLKTVADPRPVEDRDVASSNSSEDFEIRIPTPADTVPVVPSDEGDDSNALNPPEREVPTVPPPPDGRYPRRHRATPEYYGFRNGEN